MNNVIFSITSSKCFLSGIVIKNMLLNSVLQSVSNLLTFIANWSLISVVTNMCFLVYSELYFVIKNIYYSGNAFFYLIYLSGFTFGQVSDLHLEKIYSRNSYKNFYFHYIFKQLSTLFSLRESIIVQSFILKIH